MDDWREVEPLVYARGERERHVCGALCAIEPERINGSEVRAPAGAR